MVIGRQNIFSALCPLFSGKALRRRAFVQLKPPLNIVLVARRQSFFLSALGAYWFKLHRLDTEELRN